MTKKKAKPAVEDEASRRRRVIKHLEDALRLIKELNDPMTGHLIERALTEARARQFQPLSVA
jgi:DNA-binding ferritin-like protein